MDSSRARQQLRRRFLLLPDAEAQLDSESDARPVKENFHTSSWFLCGSALLLVSLSIAFYCIVYLEWYCGIGEYDVRYPALIPITTASFIAAGICFNIALWHVWSFFTPLLLFTQFMGVVMFITLLG
ncbi:PREDICTED: transmembrane protein 128 [Colobus angolensis palliatus]|uniref:transmembrane protein 128 n=1 Tax=Colobus angolensis palliatus TaxID=336983 RepID=UPI0005F46EF0|nr:PREDICTED: transmembrane protein 128 [Colobus angolensis palliatus]